MVQTQNMVKYIAKRILIMIPSLFIILTTTFILSRLMSQDPTMILLPMDAPEEQREQLMRDLGFYDPWYVQLGDYYVQFFKGDLGTSVVGITRDWPVVDWLAQAIPTTIELMFIPMVFVPILGVKMGITYKQQRFW